MIDQLGEPIAILDPNKSVVDIFFPGRNGRKQWRKIVLLGLTKSPSEMIHYLILKRFAGDLGVSMEEAVNIMDNNKPIGNKMAKRLGRVFDITAEEWLSMQERHDRDA